MTTLSLYGAPTRAHSPGTHEPAAPTRHLVIAGGGTGGHLFPGLAVAQCLRATDDRWRCTFAGNFAPWQMARIEQAGFRGMVIPAAPIGRNVGQLVRFVQTNFAGYRAASQMLCSEPVNAVLGLGGYASAPVAKAAADLNLPLALLELNAVPGRVTRWLAPQADSVLLNLASAKAWLPVGCRSHVVGLPLRSEFEQAVIRRSWHQARRPVLLVLGGSQGAQQLNECVPTALAQLRPQLSGWSILHQAGSEKTVAAIAGYHRNKVEACVVPTITDMAASMYNADLAISRSGATTLAEMAHCGLPAVLLPYPNSADDHQQRNAQYYTDAGGAVSIPTTQREAVVAALVEQLKPLLASAQQRCQMSQAMLRSAQACGALRVVRHLIQLAQSAESPGQLPVVGYRTDAPHRTPGSPKMAA